MTGFYVTMHDGKRVAFLVGPLPTLETATNAVRSAQMLATRLDPWAHFYAFGITSLAPAVRLGVFNHFVRNDRA